MILQYNDIPEYENTDECKYEGCMKMENKGCTDPNTCILKAKGLMDTLSPKWNPRNIQSENYKEPILE